jgi:hypothetical protein
MSDDLYKRAASIRKNFHVVEGANHMSLYDLPKYVDEAVSVLAPFFLSSLEELAGGPHFLDFGQTSIGRWVPGSWLLALGQDSYNTSSPGGRNITSLPPTTS